MSPASRPQVLRSTVVEAKTPGTCHRCGMPYLHDDLIEVRHVRDNAWVSGQRTEIICENCRCGWKSSW